MLGHWVTAMMMMGPVPVEARAETVPTGWLAGAWCTEGPPGDRTCEYWTPESGGLMIGASITTKSGKAVSFEHMRIASHEGGTAYFASPQGRPAVAFRAGETQAQSIIFEKLDHDYPQRIRYSIEGDALIAEISLANGSKRMRWKFKRIA